MSIILLGLTTLSFLIAVTAAVVILFRNIHSSTYRWLAAFLVFAGLWGLVVNLQNPQLSETFNLWVVRLTFVAAIAMAYAMFNFVLAVGELRLAFITRLLMGLASLVVTGLMLSDLVIPYVAILDGVVVPNRQPLYYLVIGQILVLCASALYLLAVARRRATFRQIKSQLSVILLGLSVGILLGILTNIILPNVFHSVAPARYAWLATLVWTVLLVYAVVRKGFLDIRLAVVRTAAYTLTLATLAGIYFIAASVISELLITDSSLLQPAGIILALALAFLFQPIKRFFDKLTNRIFYKDNYSIDTFFAELTRVLSHTSDLRNMLRRAAKTIADNLKSEQAFFFIFTNDGHFITTGTKKHSKLPLEDVHQLGDLKTIITTEQIETNHHLRRLLISHRIGLVMPLRRGDELVGYLFLGEHWTSGYTRQDLRALSTVSDELVIAIQNAISVHEVKDLNANLEQRIDSATKELRASNAQLQRLDEAKDEFISMASHQLRTPLTSIKGYISMMMEGDAGKISPQQKKILNEAFISSERMVRLIGDFLNVSRLQTGKFVVEKQPVDLSKLIEREIEGLQPNADARGLKFVYKRPRNIPMLNLDESKIQQVIMNFADNAIYYSKDKSTITITLRKTGDDVEFAIKDKGIGVPESEQQHLFSKFFRATNARKQRPDGTGVGLFLAKKVIDAHGGQLVFESKEGKGSTFGFRLPIKKLRATNDTN